MKNIRANLRKNENEIVFEINTKIYSLEIISRACYVFIDRVYIYLDTFKKGTVAVFLRGKQELGKKELEALRGEFFNELLNALLRENLVKKNQKILEYIVSGAITASLPKKEESKGDIDLDREIEKLKKELESIDGGDFEDDSLGIKKISKISRKKNKKK
jgi:His-Xaa-Ser system protein HxsD